MQLNNVKELYIKKMRGETPFRYWNIGPQG